MTMDSGCAEAALGNADHGIKQMQQGLAAYDATGGKLWTPYFTGLLADALGKAGRSEEALVAVKKALKLAEETGEKYSLPELYRSKGELILKSGRSEDIVSTNESMVEAPQRSPVEQAREYFSRAMELGGQLGTRSWQLRAAISLDRLETSRGNSKHTQLAEIYSCFTEGFETPDLKLAREQLNARQALTVGTGRSEK